jgi:hypothetical protein
MVLECALRRLEGSLGDGMSSVETYILPLQPVLPVLLAPSVGIRSIAVLGLKDQ